MLYTNNAFILIGPAGCGKTTLAKHIVSDFQEHGSDITIVSSDAIRAELYGDESVQKDHKKVFSIAHQRIREAVDAGKNVIFDATNLFEKNRREAIKIFDGTDYYIHGIVYDGDLETCLEQNQSRDRVVPEQVIRSMYNTLFCFPPSLAEGFTSISRMSAWV